MIRTFWGSKCILNKNIEPQKKIRRSYKKNQCRSRRRTSGKVHKKYELVGKYRFIYPQIECRASDKMPYGFKSRINPSSTTFKEVGVLSMVTNGRRWRGQRKQIGGEKKRPRALVGAHLDSSTTNEVFVDLKNHRLWSF